LQAPNLEEGEAIGSRGWYYSKERMSVPISPPYILFLLSALVCPKFYIAVFSGGCEPPIMGKGRP